VLRGAACDLSLLLHGCRGVNGSFNGWWSVTVGAGSKAFSVLKTHTVRPTAVEKKKDLAKSKQTRRISASLRRPRALEPLLIEGQLQNRMSVLNKLHFAGTSRKIGASPCDSHQGPLGPRILLIPTRNREQKLLPRGSCKVCVLTNEYVSRVLTHTPLPPAARGEMRKGDARAS
jgi:hypothetical protein